MSGSNAMIPESLIRLMDAVCSMQWGLMHWQLKKVWGEPVARDVAALALPRTSSFRKQIWADLKRLPGQDLIHLKRVLLPRKSRRRFLKHLKKELGPDIQRALNQPFLQQFKDELEKSMLQVATQYDTDQKPIAVRLYPELQCDMNTLCAEPWRAKKAFPMEILKSPREQKRLQRELGYEPYSYDRQLTSIIWQLGNNPYSLGQGPPRSNDLIFQVVEQKPSVDITSRQAARAISRLFKALGDEKKARVLFEHRMARILRSQFNLSRNRNVDSFSEIEERHRVSQGQAGADPDKESWEPEDNLSLRGYDDVDSRLVYEALRSRLPPKQRLTLDVYLESLDTGESIETICERRQLNSVGVRNNFQAVKRKFAAGKT